MLMPDVNILIYAHRTEEKTHEAYKKWLTDLVNGPAPFGFSVLVGVAFLRLVTNPRVYGQPTPLALALATVEQLSRHPRCRLMGPGPEHLQQVADLCRASQATGKCIADAQHAALAIANGCTWVSRDSDFARFAPHGLSWQHLELG